MFFGSENTLQLRFFAGRADKPDQTETVEGSARRPGLRIRRHTSTSTPSRTDCSAPQCNTGCWRTLDGPGWASASRTTGSAWANCSRRSPKSPPRIRSRHRRSSARSTSSSRSPREPDDLRSLSAAAGRQGSGQPGRGAVLLMSVEAARRLGVPRGEVGVPAWARRSGRAGAARTASTSASARRRTWLCAEALRVAGTGVDDVATFDLYSCFPFPVFAVCDGSGLATDDPRAHPDRRAAVLRRPRQQLLDARHRRDRQRNAGKARTIRPRRCQWRHHEQVLGRRLLDRACRLGARSQRGAATR